MELKHNVISWMIQKLNIFMDEEVFISCLFVYSLAVHPLKLFMISNRVLSSATLNLLCVTESISYSCNRGYA